MNMTDTLKGSYFAEVFPKGWDIEKIAACVSQLPESVTQPQPFWNPAFRPVACENLEEFGAYMGHEIAMQIRRTKEEGRKLILILPVAYLLSLTGEVTNVWYAFPIAEAVSLIVSILFYVTLYRKHIATMEEPRVHAG